MNIILILFCTLSAIFASPPRDAKVKIDLHGVPGVRAGISVHQNGHVQSGHVERANIHISHQQDNSARSETRGVITSNGYGVNDGLIGHTNVHITHSDNGRNHERGEIRMSGAGGGSFHSTAELRGTSGSSGLQASHGKIVAYGSGLTLPGHLSGNINLF